MKIAQLISGISTPVTNEESQFIRKFPSKVSISSLTERDQVLAQNLVRKGVYSISKDNNIIVKSVHETSR